MKYLCIALSALMMASCASSKVKINPLSSHGRTAMISLKDGTMRSAELIALQDSVLIAATDSLWIIPQADLTSVEIPMERNKNWVWLVGLTQALPTLVFLVAGAEDKYSQAYTGYGILGVLVTTGTVVSFMTSEPQVRYTWPLPAREADDLRLHMRFPYGVTAVQLERLQEAMYLHR